MNKSIQIIEELFKLPIYISLLVPIVVAILVVIISTPVSIFTDPTFSVHNRVQLISDFVRNIYKVL